MPVYVRACLMSGMNVFQFDKGTMSFPRLQQHAVRFFSASSQAYMLYRSTL